MYPCPINETSGGGVDPVKDRTTFCTCPDGKVIAPEFYTKKDPPQWSTCTDCGYGLEILVKGEQYDPYGTSPDSEAVDEPSVCSSRGPQASAPVYAHLSPANLVAPGSGFTNAWPQHAKQPYMLWKSACSLPSASSYSHGCHPRRSRA